MLMIRDLDKEMHFAEMRLTPVLRNSHVKIDQDANQSKTMLENPC